MGGLTLEGGLLVRAVADARVLAGSSNGVIREGAQAIRRAHAVRMEAHTMPRAWSDALVARGSGLDASVLRSTGELRWPSGARKRLVRQGVNVTSYGADPLLMHTKILLEVARTGKVARALMTTGFNMPTRMDVGLSFAGAPAQALGAATESAIDGSKLVRARTWRAAELGVLFNDPKIGASYLTLGLEAFVQQPTRRLDVIQKEFNDLPMAKLIAKASRENGTKVTVYSDMVSPRVRSILEAAGVRVRGSKKLGRAVHGNVVIADRNAIIATAYMDSAVLRGAAQRRSREVGVFVAGTDTMRDLRAAVGLKPQ